MANIDAVTTSGAILGAVLVKLRTAKEMKQADLAAAIGLGASTWSRIEKGESGLSLDQLRQVSKVLGVTPGTILDMVEVSEAEVVRQGVRIDPSATSLTSIRKGAAIGSVAAGAMAGAAIGTVIPVFGSALGAIIGGVVSAIFDDEDRARN